MNNPTLNLLSDAFKLENDLKKLFGGCSNKPYFVAQAADRLNLYLFVSIDSFQLRVMMHTS